MSKYKGCKSWSASYGVPGAPPSNTASSLLPALYPGPVSLPVHIHDGQNSFCLNVPTTMGINMGDRDHPSPTPDPSFHISVFTDRQDFIHYEYMKRIFLSHQAVYL